MRDVNNFIEEISNKFGYSQMLSGDLKRILPIMLQDKDEQKQQMLFDMLSDTKIFVLPNMALVQDLEECKAEVFGKDNKGITFADSDKGEYGKAELADGSYISEPIFDENMNIVGRNRMIFVKELPKWSELRETYQSDINLSHLIHEIGHGWAAEQSEYVQSADGSFVQNVGTGRIIHKIDKGTKQVFGVETEGIFTEESLNTIFEEQTLLNLTGAKSIDELKDKGYISSSYQGLMKSIMESYVEKFGIEAFEEYRYSKDPKALVDIETALAKTDAWTTLGTEEYTNAKRRNIATIESLDISDSAKDKTKRFFVHYEQVYFPDNKKFTPIQKIDNILEQIYNFSSVKYNFNILGNQNNLDIYKKVVSTMVAEANALRNEAVVIAKSAPGESDMMEQLHQGIKDDKSVGEYYRDKDENVGRKEIEEKEKEGR